MQGPGFVEGRRVTNLGRHAEALFIQLHPEWIGSVVNERIILRIMRREDGHRFTRGHDMTAHVALRKQMFPRPEQSLDYLFPIPDRLAIHLHNDISNNRRAHSFIGEGEMNVGRIAAVELKDGPNCSAHLLALDVSRVTGNAQRADSHKSRDDCVVSTGPARRLFLRHGADHIAGKMSVNQSSDEKSRLLKAFEFLR
jgi:hypothetical protein